MVFKGTNTSLWVAEMLPKCCSQASYPTILVAVACKSSYYALMGLLMVQDCKCHPPVQGTSPSIWVAGRLPMCYSKVSQTYAVVAVAVAVASAS